mmetsp:Transcript_23724/g.54799  ORF Transcript_23724/g.54799 Transcript_23724/m.54799 type:complete len:493 (+) Transcript_23724:110-1588(+)
MPMLSRLHQHFEQRVQHRRTLEAKCVGIREKLAEDQCATSWAQHETRAERLRRDRLQAQERAELMQERSLLEAEHERTRRQQSLDLQGRLAEELERRRAKEAREALERQRICDGSDELRDLRGKLRAASCTRALTQQVLQRDLREQREREEESILLGTLKAHQLEREEIELHREKEKLEARRALSATLTQQIQDREQKRADAQKFLEQDRQEAEELAERIRQEDLQELRMRQTKQDQTKKVMLEFRQEQAERRLAEERRQALEDANIDAFQERKRSLEEYLQKQRRQRAMEQDRLVQSLVREREEEMQATQEAEQVRELLWEEDRLEKERKRDALEANQRAKGRAYLQQAFVEHQRELERRRAAAEDEEQRYREQLFAKLAEEDRLEQLSAQKRRMKLLEHRREVERQVQMRREQLEAEALREQEAQAQERAKELYRRKIIEEERQQILAEHAAPLKGYLPRGVLQSEADYDLVYRNAETRGGRLPRNQAWT